MLIYIHYISYYILVIHKNESTSKTPRAERIQRIPLLHVAYKSQYYIETRMIYPTYRNVKLICGATLKVALLKSINLSPQPQFSPNI